MNRFDDNLSEERWMHMRKPLLFSLIAAAIGACCLLLPHSSSLSRNLLTSESLHEHHDRHHHEYPPSALLSKTSPSFSESVFPSGTIISAKDEIPDVRDLWTVASHLRDALGQSSKDTIYYTITPGAGPFCRSHLTAFLYVHGRGHHYNLDTNSTTMTHIHQRNILISRRNQAVSSLGEGLLHDIQAGFDMITKKNIQLPKNHLVEDTPCGFIWNEDEFLVSTWIEIA